MAQINALVNGHGPALILAHGWAASHRDWDAQTSVLVQAGYRVYRLDQFGHGESEKPAAAFAYTIANAYGAFCEWITSLHLNEPCALVGHSMGGYFSLRYACEHPQAVRALVLIDPLITAQQMTLPLWVIFSQPRLLAATLRLTPTRWIAALYRLTPHRRLALKTRLKIALSYKHASPLIAYLLHGLPSLQDRLGQVVAPTLLIYGKRDLSLKPDQFPDLACRIPNLVALHGLENTGHTPHVDQPECVNRELLSFLNKYLKGP